MKRKLCILATAGLLILSGSLFMVSAAEKDRGSREAPAVHGSIRPKGKLTTVERAALAKISFQDAMAAAVAVVPGQVVDGELEVEDGNLQYGFEIVGAGKKVTDVAIDAGNGKVLGIEAADED